MDFRYNQGMQTQPIIAIVGRPNVGKSAIFNQMVGRRVAIVHDEPGVTRDRLSAPCRMTGHACVVTDTGGIGATLDDGFAERVAQEADLAMKTADAILLVMDCRDHMTPIDEEIARKLHCAEIPVILVLNKADTEKQELNVGEFSSLGFKDVFFVSAAHGRGFAALAGHLDRMLAEMGAPTATDEDESEREEDGTSSESERPLKVAIVGKPNAGKSSLVNAMLNDERTIVSEIAGTTRDAVDIPYTRGEQQYMLIDTAGMRPRSKRDTSVEVFSAMRSEKAIRRADVCLLVIDAVAGVTAQDRRIGGIIAEEGKPCIIILNKFDLFYPSAPLKARRGEAEEMIRKDLFFLDYAPFVEVSARQVWRIDHIFRMISKVRDEAASYPGTGQLNRLLQETFERNPPPLHRQLHKRLKLYYAAVALNEKYKVVPVPEYVLFVNDKRLLSDNYAQFVKNTIRSRFKATGIPVVLSPRSRVRND